MIYSHRNFEDEKRLVVFGGAEIMVPADNAKFSFEINENRSTLTEAVEKVKTKIMKSLKELNTLQILPEKLHTNGMVK